MKKTVWAVYGQYIPTHKYEECIESLWSTKQRALVAAQEMDTDYVWVQEINVDNVLLVDELSELVMVKKP